jgi:hypothetical protein
MCPGGVCRVTHQGLWITVTITGIFTVGGVLWFKYMENGVEHEKKADQAEQA